MQIDPRLSEIQDCLYRLAVKAVITQAGKILLVREKGDEWWSLPGGGIDHGESVEEALKRELVEELGIQPDDVEISDKVEFVTVGAVLEGIPKANLIYRVSLPADTIRVTPDVEEFGWFRAEDLKDLYLSPSTGDITGQLTQLLAE